MLNKSARVNIRSASKLINPLHIFCDYVPKFEYAIIVCAHYPVRLQQKLRVLYND